jgi:hypothetical protein
MKPPAGPALIALALAAVALTAGCGAAASSGPGAAAQAPPGGAPFLATSLVTPAGTWAIAVMGGSVVSHNNFWQMFARPPGSTVWKLVTPAGVADNGGLVAASVTAGPLIAGIRPSQLLTYTPLALTRDGGRAWSPTGPLDAALAAVPDALAAAPGTGRAAAGTGRLLALLTNGTVKTAVPGYTRWASLTSQRSIAVTPAGRRCGLASLTAVTATPAGVPLLAGRCSRPGAAGIFAGANGTWQAAGPALPAGLDHQAVTVLRLTRTSTGNAALLETGTGADASLLAAWSAGNGAHWALSPPFRLHGARLASASFGSGGAVSLVLAGNRSAAITGAGAAWRPLPALPAGTATLAPGPSGGFDALAVHRTRLTVWQLAPGTAGWRTTQTMNVPVQFGSSG